VFGKNYEVKQRLEAKTGRNELELYGSVLLDFFTTILQY
jgi:hypothetical protein